MANAASDWGISPRVAPNDRLTPDHLQRALAGSPTARELVDRIERLPNTVLIVRAHPLLVRRDGLLGRGKFWVVRERLFGLLEYQAEPVGSNRAVRILAHELAHALEIALAPRVDINSLRAVVLARESDERTGMVAGIETEFARAVGYRVQLELLNRRPPRSFKPPVPCPRSVSRAYLSSSVSA